MSDSFMKGFVTLLSMGLVLLLFTEMRRKELSKGTKPKEVKAMDWVMLILSGLIFVYLSVTLLFPEKF